MKRLATIIVLALAMLPYLMGAVAVSTSSFTNSSGLAGLLSDETGTGAAVFGTSPTLTTPILGTPTSGTLTNCTLPVGGVSGLGTGVGTFLATPTSANLASAITNETGSGLAVFDTSPTLVTPTLGVATATSVTAGGLTTTGVNAVTAGGNVVCGSGGTGRGLIMNGGNGPSISAPTTSTATIYMDAAAVISGNSKALTESSATAFVQVAAASGSCVGGRISYVIVADDSTDFQTRSGSVNFAIVNKAGTETITFGTVSSEAAALSSGTLSVSFDGDTSPTNAVNLRANAVSSLTQTTLAIKYRVEIFGPAVTVTPQ